MDTSSNKFQPPTIPRDDEGYVKSFDILNYTDSEKEEARRFFDQYGFVVFSNVFTPEQCKETIDDIWDVIESFVKRPIRNDESLWTNSTWSRTGLVNEGIIGDASLWTRRIILNRQIPTLHAAYASILGTEDLLVNHDRYGLFRPTENHSERQTMTNLHLDMNPWSHMTDTDNSYQIKVLTDLEYDSDDDWITENNEPGCAAVGELHVQGLVNLADNKEEDGGFWLVPGFHKYLPQWTADNMKLMRGYGARGQFILLGKHAIPDMYAAARHISTRAGSAIFWNQRTMHGSVSNRSSRPRFAQFFKMFPTVHPAMTPARAKHRRSAILEKLRKAKVDPDADLTPLGKKLFGLEIPAETN